MYTGLSLRQWRGVTSPPITIPAVVGLFEAVFSKVAQMLPARDVLWNGSDNKSDKMVSISA